MGRNIVPPRTQIRLNSEIEMQGETKTPKDLKKSSSFGALLTPNRFFSSIFGSLTSEVHNEKENVSFSNIPEPDENLSLWKTVNNECTDLSDEIKMSGKEKISTHDMLECGEKIILTEQNSGMQKRNSNLPVVREVLKDMVNTSVLRGNSSIFKTPLAPQRKAPQPPNRRATYSSQDLEAVVSVEAKKLKFFKKMIEKLKQEVLDKESITVKLETELNTQRATIIMLKNSNKNLENKIESLNAPKCDKNTKNDNKNDEVVLLELNVEIENLKRRLKLAEVTIQEKDVALLEKEKIISEKSSKIVELGSKFHETDKSAVSIEVSSEVDNLKQQTEAERKTNIELEKKLAIQEGKILKREKIIEDLKSSKVALKTYSSQLKQKCIELQQKANETFGKMNAETVELKKQVREMSSVLKSSKKKAIICEESVNELKHLKSTYEKKEIELMEKRKELEAERTINKEKLEENQILINKIAELQQNRTTIEEEAQTEVNNQKELFTREINELKLQVFDLSRNNEKLKIENSELANFVIKKQESQ